MHTLFYIIGGVLVAIVLASVAGLLLVSYAFRKNTNWDGRSIKQVSDDRLMEIYKNGLRKVNSIEKLRLTSEQMKAHKRLKDLKDRGATDEEAEEIAFELARIEDELAHK